LCKVAEVFADPLMSAAKNDSEKQDVPRLFAWWVFHEWHRNKFPTADGALRSCDLGPQLEKDGFGFSRPTVGRWLKIIHDELEERKLLQKCNLDRGAFKARGFDVTHSANAYLNTTAFSSAEKAIRQFLIEFPPRPKAMLKPRALQTVRDCRASSILAQRLGCGAFTGAFSSR